MFSVAQKTKKLHVLILKKNPKPEEFEDRCPKNKIAHLHKRGAKGAEGGRVNGANKTGKENGCPHFFQKEYGYNSFFLENFKIGIISFKHWNLLVKLEDELFAKLIPRQHLELTFCIVTRYKPIKHH